MAWGAVVAAVVAAGSTAASMKKARGARHFATQANATQLRINQALQRRQNREFVRKFRKAQAATLVAGIGAGVGLDSSVVQGTLGSQTSQVQTELNETLILQDLQRTKVDQMQRVADLKGKQQMWQGIGQVAQSFSSFGS